MTKKQKAKIIDGKILSEQILKRLKQEISELPRQPGLAVILIGDDAASALYVKNKKNAARKVGINFSDYLCGGKFYNNISENEIVEMIHFLNNDPTVDGIIVQLPLPKKFNTKRIIEAIDPQKDVDGFHPQNQKKISNKEVLITSPLIKAIWYALLSTDIEFKGKNAIIVSKNPIFSKPLAKDLEKAGLHVSVITPEDNMEKKLKNAEVVVSVVGKPKLIKKEMIKPNAVVIDVGTTLIGNNKWSGDVEKNVEEVASWITPVPGGIGPLTVAMLLYNTYQISSKNQGIKK